MRRPDPLRPRQREDAANDCGKRADRKIPPFCCLSAMPPGAPGNRTTQPAPSSDRSRPVTVFDERRLALVLDDGRIRRSRTTHLATIRDVI